MAVHDHLDPKEHVADLDSATLEAFLDHNGLGAGPVRVAPIGDGHSNLTYRIRRDVGEWVLRRPPRGPLPPSAHDVLREFRILRACAGNVRVPVLSIGSAEPTNTPADLRSHCPTITIGQTVGAGHFNQLEVPQQVNLMIDRFLAITGLSPAP